MGINLNQYLAEITATYSTGVATEHSYRASLEKLLSSIAANTAALNEPKRVQCGAPDFLINRGGIVIGHVEAKDINKDLANLNDAEGEQKDRYLKGLPNLIYTNGLDFEFYRDGVRLSRVSIGKLASSVTPMPENFESLRNLLIDFAAQRPQSITSAEKLAAMMAGKALLIKDVLFNTLELDVEENSELSGQYKAFREYLIHDITTQDFADIYAETIAYGMFAARLHDDTLDTFSRQEALDLLPKSNPFLRSLFGYVAGHDLDDRIKWIIDDLADVFQAANVNKIMQNFGSLTARTDPFIHFYETFLTKYNPAKRKARGVWYTPEPVVNFIVRAVDQVLQDEFALVDGLADTSKISVDWDTGQTNKKGKPVTIRKELHRVQILDPATGTGTFLAEVIKQIAPKVKGVAPGLWSSYIARDLIPRLHGFELLMASYAMCHMKLDMILTELGYKAADPAPRLSVFLTNSLEEGEREVRDLFMAQWLTREAKEANNIKRQHPIMCIIGNPPYNIMSENLSKAQISLIDAYRYVDGKKIKEKGMLQFEKNINNDYIKFLALSEKLIVKNKSGVLAFVTSHGYLKSSSFRGLRQSLMKSFNTIRILDLHGNSEVREVVPDGIIDNNIFDIKQGVSVIIASKTGEGAAGAHADVFYSEIWGSRATKYDKLFNSDIGDMLWVDCSPSSPNYTFHPSGKNQGKYQSEFFSITDLMKTYSSGIITARDAFTISESREILVANAKAFAGDATLSDHDLCKKLGIAIKKGWDIAKARKRLRAIKDYDKLVQDIAYRPFDNRKILFDESLVWTTARSTMDHMLWGKNIALVSARSEKSGTCSHFYVSDKLVETKCGERTTQSAVFPLYFYNAPGEMSKSRSVNFNPKIYAKIQKISVHPTHGSADEIAVFDYIYGTLHSPRYRAAYAEFLKIEFPRIPWPDSADHFWNISKKGARLRKLHLMDNSAIGLPHFPFSGEGDGLVEHIKYQDNRVWINDRQYFDHVPEIAWNFFIGGYQPARQWLKVRRGRALSFDDIKHYQKIIQVLIETDKTMKTMDD